MCCWIVGIPSTSVSKLNCHDSVLEGKKGDSFQNKNPQHFFPRGLFDTQNRPGCTNRTKCCLSGHLVFIWDKKTTLPSSLHPSFSLSHKTILLCNQKSYQETETNIFCCSLLTVCPVSSAWRVGGPGIHMYTRMIRSVPPVTKNLPPEEKGSHLVPLLVQLEKQHPLSPHICLPGLKAEQRVWSPILFFSMNLIAVALQTDQLYAHIQYCTWITWSNTVDHMI